jgi:cation:H+ antiporter
VKNWLWLGGAAALPLQWIIVHFSGIHLSPHWEALSSGSAIFGAAFLLSWAAELAQLDIPQTLALAFLALIAVLPEYAVDIYFAWMAGKDPTYTAFATANMTGANRLLIGLGWAAVVIAYWLKTGERAVKLEKGQGVELFYLSLATLYSFVIPLKGTLSLIDCFLLLALFAMYIVSASRSHIIEPELEGPSEMIARSTKGVRRAITIFLFLYSGFAILVSAEPFAEGLLATGRTFGIEEFILVQWLAPLASESPEFIVAILFALRENPRASMSTLVSSKVNQWTLLIGMLPLAYCLSRGSIGVMELDSRQVEEIFLTSAQSLFAVVIIVNFIFTLQGATVLLLLFTTQLVSTAPAVRYAYAAVYLVFALGLLAMGRSRRAAFVGLFLSNNVFGRGTAASGEQQR